jgi:endonuclease/exonuclease/phosphatase family metal-dependent hydrolase
MKKHTNSIVKFLAFAFALTTAFFFSTAQAADGLKLMTYNVRHGSGLDNKTDYARTCGVINGEAPDVIALQEIDCKTKRSDGADVLEEFSKLTGMHPTFGASIDFQGGQYGNGVLSKEKPISVNCCPLPGSEEKRSVLIVEFEKYVFCSTHWSLTEKDRDASVAVVTEKMKEQKKPVFLCGDFNAQLKENSMKTLQKDWTLLNAEDATFPADKPKILIDYICAADPAGNISNDDWKASVKEAYVVDEKVASDHRPVVVVIDDALLQ